MTIPNIFFVVLIGITTAYLTFLTTKGGLTDNRFNGLAKRLTKRGKTVLFVLLFMLVLLVGQEYNNQNLNAKNENLLKKETLSRDSIITANVKIGVDSSREKLFKDLSKAFAKESLVLDTLNNKIQILRDSVKTLIINYNGDDPILMMDKNAISLKDTSKRSGGYKISFKSIDAGSSSFDIKCYVLTLDENGYDLSKFNLFPKGLKIPKNSAWTTSYGSSAMPIANKIDVYIKGTYSNIEGTKKYSIDNLYEYNSESDITSILLNTAREKVMKIIKSVPENKLILR